MNHGVDNTNPIFVNNDFLRAWPLPLPSSSGDKEERGRVLVIGGSREMPGAVILAATAALRAGAGKLAIATGASVAQLVALAIPESRVIGLPETDEGGITLSAVEAFNSFADKLDAVLIGPGMQDEAATCEFAHALLLKLSGASIVLDACAMAAAIDSASSPHPRDAFSANADFEQPILLTPHAGEMAHLTGMEKEQVLADPGTAARIAAKKWRTTIALKGATTYIAAPDGRLWQHEGGNVGLATSGSGDTLAGIIAGLAARGAPLEQACVWGVALHARAGEQLALRLGPLGYLASELSAEIPALMHALSPQSRRH
jgi:ADP-dependent NAD(P)H-hydrate dehydratase